VDSSQVGYLDQQYQAYLSNIPDSRSKNNGIALGEAGVGTAI